VPDLSPVHAEAAAFCDHVIPAQNALREVADELETLVADDLWPLPKYRELLFQY
jgi:glutamine synthetase